MVLDLGTDESLVEAGLAREVVNRVQKLRKKAGLVASDVVDVFVDATQHASGGLDNSPLAPARCRLNQPPLRSMFV